MISRFHWHPSADPEILDPWVPQLDILKRNPLKSNGKRYVFRVVNLKGAGFYVKLEEKKGLIPLLRNWFMPKVRSEYNSGRLLEKLDIPCIHYAAWGTCGSAGVLVSQELVGYVPLSELWYSTLLHDSRECGIAVRHLAELVTRFVQLKLYHPDFHIGNILIDPDTLSLAITDAYGICRSKQDPARLLPCMLELRSGDMITDTLMIDELARAGFPNPAENYQRALELHNKLLDHEWPRRIQQILKGNSKFACSPTPGRWIRNSAWFSPLELPSDLEVKMMDAKTAEQIWLESFRLQLQRLPLEKVPVIYEKSENFSAISYTTDKKYKTFYGF